MAKLNAAAHKPPVKVAPKAKVAAKAVLGKEEYRQPGYMPRAIGPSWRK